MFVYALQYNVRVKLEMKINCEISSPTKINIGRYIGGVVLLNVVGSSLTQRLRDSRRLFTLDLANTVSTATNYTGTRII